MLAIKDLDGEVYLLTGASNIVRKRRVNGEKELSLKLEKTEQNARFFDDIEKLWRVIDFSGEEYPVLLYRDVAEGHGYKREISCLHSFYDDMRNHVIYGTFSGSKTFVDMMEFIFSGSGYTYNIIDTFYAQSFENFGDDYGLELFKKALERYKSEFSVNGLIVELRSQIGNTTDFQYRHKFNLESIERETDALDFSTYGEGFGKDGLHVVYRSPLADIYGERPIKAIRDERFSIEENLLEKVQEAVDSSLKIALTVKLSDLRASGYNKNHPDEGDTIILVEDRFDLKIDARIVEIVELLDKNGKVIDCDVTLSNFSNIFEQQRRIHNATKTIADAIEGKRPLPFEALAIAVQQATIALQNAQTELHFPDSGGILAIDKTDPNKLVLFNSAGIGISDDGGQTFKTAMTGGGFVGDVITSGTINTAFVRIEGTTGNIYMTGDEFKALDPVDPDKYVSIKPGEIYAKKGTMTVEREDGFKTIIGGYMNFNVAIGTHQPPFVSTGVSVSGYFYSTNQTDWQNAGYFTFRHEHRYFKIRIGHYRENYYGVVALFKNGVNVAQKTFDNAAAFDDVESLTTLTVDLGVPTGQMDDIYLMFRSSVSSSFARIRNRHMWLEG